MTRLRRIDRTPASHVRHGTKMGWKWHTEQRKRDPEHKTCPKCKRFWREYIRDYRQRKAQP